MTDEEIIQYVNYKFKHCKNKINSVKEVFPKEPNTINNFDKVLYEVMEDYIKENTKKTKKK